MLTNLTVDEMSTIYRHQLFHTHDEKYLVNKPRAKLKLEYTDQPFFHFFLSLMFVFCLPN